MPHPIPLQRLTAISLSSFYAICFVIPTTLATWMVRSAQAQSLPATRDDASGRPTSRDLVEEARQRLIDRGELLAEPREDGSVWVEEGTGVTDFETYRLGPGDSVFVSVLRFKDLSFQGTLDQEGNLLVPLLGALPLEGFTVEQARELIRVGLNRYVIDPQVDVILVAQRPVQVTVLGEVFKPGLYPLQAPQLTTALISAGGTTGMADLRMVRIRRSLPDGSLIEQDIDLFSPLRDAQALPNIRLADGDTIVVPTLTAENSEEYDRNLIARSTLAQPQINVRVFNRAGGGRTGSIGTIQLPNGSTFIDALTAISPDLSNANIRDIALIRYDVEQAEAVSQELNGRDALMGDMSQNPLLEHNDVIVIGRNLISRITNTLNTFTQPFRDVLGFLLFFDSLADSAESLFGPSGSSEK